MIIVFAIAFPVVALVLGVRVAVVVIVHPFLVLMCVDSMTLFVLQFGVFFLQVSTVISLTIILLMEQLVCTS